LDESVKTKIGYEISRIEKLITDAKPLFDLCKIREPDFIEITATAQILHSFYNGVESVIVLFFKNYGEKLPNDIHWHKSLFEMAFGNNSKNLKIINADIKEKLEEYLSYRHFIRHSYSSELKWNEMASLVKELDIIWEEVKMNFEMFMQNN
jgi:uncharacterized protein (UPF0332 family)